MLQGTILSMSLGLLTTLVVAQPANRTDAQGRKQGEWARTWDHNGRLRYSGTFKDGRPIGEFKHYDEEGALTTIQRHAGDGRTSRAEHFHAQGRVLARGKYVDQKKDSLWSYFDAHGALRRTEGYRMGTLHGDRISYYPDGRVADHEYFREGVQHGEHKAWFADGSRRLEARYENGVANGMMTFFYPGGKKEIEGRMVNGDRDGAWFYYNPDGSIQLQVLYSRGRMVREKKENGTFKEFYDDERPMSEVTYRKGMREGPFTEYHDNGQWVIEMVPADMALGAPAFEQRVLKGQTKKREGTYRNDLLDGEVKEYDERGKLLRTTRYMAGEVASGR